MKSGAGMEGLPTSSLVADQAVGMSAKIPGLTESLGVCMCTTVYIYIYIFNRLVLPMYNVKLHKKRHGEGHSLHCPPYH